MSRHLEERTRIRGKGAKWGKKFGREKKKKEEKLVIYTQVRQSRREETETLEPEGGFPFLDISSFFIIMSP